MVAFTRASTKTQIDAVRDPRKDLLELIRRRSASGATAVVLVVEDDVADKEFDAEMAAWSYASDLALVNCEAWE